MTGTSEIVLWVAGAVVLLLAVIDLFLTVFNYDGFTFLASRVHAGTWTAVRVTRRLVPSTLRPGYLSLGSAAMLPLTLLWWLALELTGFAMIYLPGAATGGFSIQHHIPTGQAAFYLSGGALTSLTFGDVLPVAAPYRALLDLETVIGLATFTIGLTYVLAAFDAVGSLNQLHGQVRRQAITPNQPQTILARHFRHRHAEELTGLLQSLVEDLAAYDDALRRYPVVFYFHTRRPQRSIPQIFSALGEVIELLRWGLPAGEDTTVNPYLLALQDQYATTAQRLLRSFVGPVDPAPPPVSRAAFASAYAGEAHASLRDFADLRRQAQDATGITTDGALVESLHEQYAEWLPFHHLRIAVTERVAHALCYPKIEDLDDL